MVTLACWITHHNMPTPKNFHTNSLMTLFLLKNCNRWNRIKMDHIIDPVMKNAQLSGVCWEGRKLELRQSSISFILPRLLKLFLFVFFCGKTLELFRKTRRSREKVWYQCATTRFSLIISNSTMGKTQVPRVIVKSVYMADDMEKEVINKALQVCRVVSKSFSCAYEGRLWKPSLWLTQRQSISALECIITKCANFSAVFQPQGLEKYDQELELASYLKRYFDEKYQPTWHCVVGQKFGSCVSFEDGYFIHFYIEKTAIVLFRTPDCPLPSLEGKG